MPFNWTGFFSTRRRSTNNGQPSTTTTITPTTPTTSVATLTPSDELWDLVLDMDWPNVIGHCAERPQNAQWQDGHWDETPLYLACQFHPPADAIKAIIQAYPKAVTIPSRENHDLPIHLSCRYQAPIEVLEALLNQDDPSTVVEQTRWGKTPLTLLWEFRPTINTTTSNNDTNDDDDDDDITTRRCSLDDDVEFRSKVDLLLNAVARYRYNKHRTCKQKQLSLEHCHHTESNFGDVDNSIQANPTTTTTTTAADNATTTKEEEEEENTSLLLVHAAVLLGARCCPMEILEYVLRKYPKQISKRDKFDELPLHIILGPTSFSKATKRKYKPREQSFISKLLQIYPEAAKETAPIRFPGSSSCDSSSASVVDDEVNPNNNSNGQQQTQKVRQHRHCRYPLHIALSNRHCWFGGIQDLFLAGPDVLLVQDPITKLYPFQLAAVPVGETTVDLDTIYHLLRSEPTILSFFEDSNKKKRKLIDDGKDTPTSHAATTTNNEESISNKKPPSQSKTICSPLTMQEVILGIVTAIILGAWAASSSSHLKSE